MAKNAATQPASAQFAGEDPASSRPSLAPVIEINVRQIGRKPQPERLVGAAAPEGWIKKVDRPREGKVWVGYSSRRDRQAAVCFVDGWLGIVILKARSGRTPLICPVSAAF